jgi:hypothetical protein
LQAARIGITQGRSMAGEVAVVGLLERHGEDGRSRVRVANGALTRSELPQSC